MLSKHKFNLLLLVPIYIFDIDTTHTLGGCFKDVWNVCLPNLEEKGSNSGLATYMYICTYIYIYMNKHVFVVERQSYVNKIVVV